MVLQAGIKAHKENGGAAIENPAGELSRARVKQKDLHLPEPSQFRGLVDNLRKGSGPWGSRVGDLVEFLAYGGMRVRSEAVLVAWDDVDWQRKEISQCAGVRIPRRRMEVRRAEVNERQAGSLLGQIEVELLALVATRTDSKVAMRKRAFGWVGWRGLSARKGQTRQKTRKPDNQWWVFHIKSDESNVDYDLLSGVRGSWGAGRPMHDSETAPSTAAGH